MSNQESMPVSEPAPARKRRISPIWILLGVLLLAVIGGSVAGFFSGKTLKAEREQANLLSFDIEQFQLAKADIGDGNYKRAVERLDSVLKNEPDFPGAEELKAQALAAMNATPTPLPTSTPVPSPTPDAPRAEQLLAQARQQFVDKQYTEMIATLLTLKTEVPGYPYPERVDGLLWVALRYNGVHLIRETNRLTEGLYYLDLAANYAPLDKEALDQAEFARVFLSIYQSAYYYRDKDIEESWKYFEQTVSMREYYSDELLRDYVDILVQMGDSLKNTNACAAWWYYERALVRMPDYEPAKTGRDYAQQNCGQSEPVPPDGYGPAPDSQPEATPEG
jgi:tetratricopeptide (TPR) repeat protein